MTTDRPNKMWGTDGAKVQTLDEGLVWIFAAVDHCSQYRSDDFRAQLKFWGDYAELGLRR
ncbi:MAG: hypothetical protein VB137_05900 [Burkholderia sp.]